METWITIIGYLLAPISGVASYFAGKKKADNDFLQNMQASIDLLAQKNKELMEEVIKLREENIQLRQEVEELNARLANIKTITKQAK
jgi:regulator of replication initiation timing